MEQLMWVIPLIRRWGSIWFFFKQKTAYDIVSRDWSSDVCSSDLKDIRKRGSPSKNSEDEPSEHGRHSFYQPSEYLETLKQVIAKPMARKLIFAYLLESNLIH